MTLKDADKIKEAIMDSDDFVGCSDDIKRVIDSVPEVAISTDTDTISRQAAIDALGEYLIGKKCPDDGTLTARLIENNVINKLPPVQPERTPMQELLDVTADRDYWKAQCHSYEMTINRLTESAEPERIKGRWIHVGGTRYRCNKCGEIARRGNFCPNCGADMRGEQNE